MAGRRQHYLPKFLQAGFASKTIGDRIFTWVFRKDRAPFEANTRHVGVEQDFYAQGDDQSVDEIITHAEANEFAAVVNEARVAPAGVIGRGSFPCVLAHLEVRSRHLRRSFQTTGEHLLGDIFSVMDRPADFLDVLQKHVTQHPDSLVNAAHEVVQQSGGNAEYDAEELAARTKQNLPAAIHALAPEFSAVFAAVKAKLPDILARAAKKGQVDALVKSIAPPMRVAQYDELTFALVDVPSNDLILGDCGVFFHVAGSRPFKSFSEKQDEVLAAVLPVSPNRVVVGSSLPYRLEVSELRRAIARCSSEFFVAHERSGANEELVEQIGSDAAPLNAYQVSAIARTALAGGTKASGRDCEN